MKRSIKGICKFLALGIITIFTTVVIFRQVRPPKDSNSSYNKVRGVNPVPPPERLFRRVEKEGNHDSFDAESKGNSVYDNSVKIDWHSYEQIQEDKARIGNGEQGKSASLPLHITEAEKENLYATNGFNALLSDNISLNRSLPDIRKEGCKKKRYRAKLPSVSVIVPFHNEHWSTLLRTVWSVINRSPSNLLKEIILVDDFSSKEHCKKPLDEYVATQVSRVKVIHLPQRDGLIRARLAGAKVAQGDVLLFLDSHTEANVNWLPPLLEPIAEDYRTCVCPLIDVISYETFEYRAQDEGGRGAFDWEFYYKRLPLLPEDLKNPTEPFNCEMRLETSFGQATFTNGAWVAM